MNNIVEILRGKNSLISTNVKDIHITNKDKLVIGIVFSNFSKKSDFKTIEIRFSEIIEYNFYYNNDYIFYNVESFKLLKISSFFYLSLDPDDEVEGISSNDMDFIKCNKIEIIELES